MQAFERWLTQQSAAGNTPDLTLTYSTQDGDAVSTFTLSIDPVSQRASKTDDPLYQDESMSGVNPIYTSER